jgi:hypothetical protein
MMVSMKNALQIEINEIKEEKRGKLAELLKELETIKGEYAQTLNTKTNALITISAEVASLKSYLSLLKLTGSNAKALG